MKRIVGLASKAKAEKLQQPKPSGLDDIVETSDRKADGIEFQISQLDNELRKISQQMQKLPVGAARQSLQTKARTILLRKKRYEQQAEQLREKSFNMGSLSSTLSNAQDTVVVTSVMKSSTKSLKKQLRKVNVDKIEDVQGELTDLIELTEDVQEAVSKSYPIPQNIDDDELNAQLELLGDEIILDNDPSYIDAVLNPKTEEKPAGPPEHPFGVDEFGLPILNMGSKEELENTSSDKITHS